jgi:hypothetical protein
MDLGLGNLISLKRHLLAPDLQAEATWDNMIVDIGRGVAAHFERFCNRLWAYTVGEIDEFTADRQSWILRRAPVVSITSVEGRDDLAAGWVSLGAVNSVLINWGAKSGLVDFGAVQGDHATRLRITYTGGYWYDTTEDATGVQPVGSTALPAHVRAAWLLQCEKVWEVIDPLGTGIAKGGSNVQLVGLSLAGLELIPGVKQMLMPEKRYAVT